jgi:hypothetical protein
MPHSLTLPPLANDRSAIGWQIWCDCVGIPAPVARRLWTAMGNSHHSLYTTLKFQLAGLLRCSKAQRRARVLRLHQGLLAPVTFLPLLENLQAAGWCTRADVTAVSERLLAQTDAAGRWAWLPK